MKYIELQPRKRMSNYHHIIITTKREGYVVCVDFQNRIMKKKVLTNHFICHGVYNKFFCIMKER